HVLDAQRQRDLLEPGVAPLQVPQAEAADATQVSGGIGLDVDVGARVRIGECGRPRAPFPRRGDVAFPAWRNAGGDCLVRGRYEAKKAAIRLQHVVLEVIRSRYE